MKIKVCYLTVIIICVSLAVLLFLAKAFCEDEQLVLDTLYIATTTSHYFQVSLNTVFQTGAHYEHTPQLSYALSLMSFLEKKEKSPPLSYSNLL